MIQQLGAYLFRTRNAIFPIVFGGLLIAFPPRPFGEWWSVAVLCLAAAAALLGQALRIATVGLEYIKRGGVKKQVFAQYLVTGGMFAHSRNPLYAGNILISLGLLAMTGNPWAAGLGAAFYLVTYHALMRNEEIYLADRFGPQYQAYAARVPRWIPRLRGIATTLNSYRFDWRGVVVKEHGTIFTTLMIGAGILACRAYRSGLLDAWAPWLIGFAALCCVLYALVRYLKKARGLRSRGVQLAEGALDDRRRRVDALDAAILDLLNARARHVAAIFEWKKLNGVDRFDPTRVERILRRLESMNAGPLRDDEVRALFAPVLDFFSHRFAAPPTA